MKLSFLPKDQEKDKVEITKQQVIEIQKVYDCTIHPKKNHILFEINLVEKTISEAVFDSEPEIKWEDAVRGLISTNKKLTKKENCIYIPALNRKNVVKILKLDFEKFCEFKHI